MIKKILSNLLIAVGILFGIIFTGFIFSDGLINIILLFLFPFPLFLLGQWLRLGTVKFREGIAKYTLIFIQIAVLIPLLFLLFDYYNKLKSDTYERDGFLWFETSSSTVLDYIMVFLFITLVLILLSKALQGWTFGGKTVSLLMIGVLFASTVLFFITWDDYKGVHASDGIVVSSRTSKEEKNAWSSIDRVELIPFVKKRIANKYGTRQEFAWKYEFFLNDGSTITFEDMYLSEFNLHRSERVKEKIEEERIPLHINEMNSKTKKWYELELEVDHVNRAPFDKLFN